MKILPIADNLNRWEGIPVIDLFPMISCVGVIIFFVSKYRETLK
ncbi:hypothetical protein [Mesobacillus foraminis]|nr:hypothetical protein [Mesobacillus foraminis]